MAHAQCDDHPLTCVTVPAVFQSEIGTPKGFFVALVTFGTHWSILREMQSDRKTVTAIVIGAGRRGTSYCDYARDFPHLLRVVAVAEPLAVPRQRIRRWFNLPDDRVFTDWRPLVALGRIADCAFVCTQDRDHCEPAVELARMGYHLLLEKPMAVNVNDCNLIADACRSSGVILAVCHVLRYLPPVLTIARLIQEGAVGRVAHIQHTERVGFEHFAHSFVRGNWRREDESSFSLLAKCCHDVDLIQYWMGRRCVSVSSVGSLLHFRKESQPVGASDRCTSCPANVERTCPYSAKKIYLGPSERMRSFRSAVCDPDSVPAPGPQAYQQALEQALEEGPYGRCVYRCDNDVCDQQVVNFQFDDGSTATLLMIAFTQQLCRRSTRIYGSHGQLEWDGTTDGPIRYYNFRTGETQDLAPDKPQYQAEPGRFSGQGLAGHGGADFGLVDGFVQAVATGERSFVHSGLEDSLQSHLLVFAAENARIKGETTHI